MWINDKYFYTAKTLQMIAKDYHNLYSGFSLIGTQVKALFSIAEYKADFDISLQSIGKGKWKGCINDYKFKDFNYCGKLQQIVIAQIFGVEDHELERIGFYDIPRLRGYSYYLMAKYLNGDNIET